MTAACRASFQGTAPPFCDPCDFYDDFAGGGSDILPLLLSLDFRSVVVQPKYTIADVTALGVPTPSRYYNLTQAAVPLTDGSDGAQNFTTLTAASGVMFQRTQLGLSADGTTFQGYTGLEFGLGYNAASSSVFTVGNTTFGNVGAAGSGNAFAFGLLYRCGQITPTPVNSSLINKRDPAGTNIGWVLGLNGVRWRLQCDDGPSAVTVQTAAGNSYAGGTWNFVIGRVRRQGGANDVAEILTVYETVSGDISALGTLSNAVPLALGAVAGVQTVAGHQQLAALWIWEGANAIALTQAHVQTMFKHATDPTGKLTTYTRAGTAADQIGSQAGFGLLTVDYSGLSAAARTAQVDIGWKNAFSHTSKLGLRTTEAITNLVTDSDNYSVAAWTKTTMTIGTASADLVDSTRRLKNAQKLTATGNNALISLTVATVAATEYTMSIYLKSGTGGNVACRLIQRNVTAGADNAVLDIVATTDWQRFDLTATTAAGQISSAFRLRVDVSGAIVHATMANFYLGKPGQLVRTDAAAATMPRTNAQLLSSAGQYIRAKRGKMRAVYACDTATDASSRNPLNAGLAGGSGNDNRRDLYIASGGGVLHAESFNDAAVFVSDIGASSNDASIEHDATYEWDAEHLLPGLGVHDRLIDNGVQFLGSAAGWLAQNNGTTIYVANAKAAAGTNALKGLLALAEFYG